MMLHPGGELVSDVIARTGVWEPFESVVMGQLLHPGDCVFDVGANVGYYTNLARQRVAAEGKVYAFEPDAENFILLEANAPPGVSCYRTALSDSSGNGFLSRDSLNKGDLYVCDSSGEPTDLLQGDDLEVAHVHFLKIDTQGSEVRVLQGLKDTIARSHHDLSMLVEFWPYGLERVGDGARALVDVLLALALPVYLVDSEAGRLRNLTVNAFENLAMEKLTVAHRGFVNLLLSNRSVDI